MSMKSLALVFFCIAFLACASGEEYFLRYLSRGPITRYLQTALLQQNNSPGGPDDVFTKQSRSLARRAMVLCGNADCCPKHYHHCCESGTRCCDFTGRRSMTYSCY